MSWRDDTDWIIADSCSDDAKTAVIKSASFNHNTIPPTSTLTVVETATVFFQHENIDRMRKDERGVIIPENATIFISDTSSVQEKHRIYITGTVSFYEVEKVMKYKGHFELKVKEVRGR